MTIEDTIKECKSVKGYGTTFSKSVQKLVAAYREAQARIKELEETIEKAVKIWDEKESKIATLEFCLRKKDEALKIPCLCSQGIRIPQDGEGYLHNKICHQSKAFALKP